MATGLTPMTARCCWPTTRQPGSQSSPLSGPKTVELYGYLLRRHLTPGLAEVRGGGFAFRAPKSRAGKRMVSIPQVILPVIQWHLACFAQEGDEGLVY
jgi:hypothetical protein